MNGRVTVGYLDRYIDILNYTEGRWNRNGGAISVRVSLEWLNEYIAVNKEDVLETLPKLGIDIEENGPVFPVYGPIIFGKIEHVEKHPRAKKLMMCKVNIGNECRTILTADTSVQAGKYVCVALEGARLSNGVEIQDREMLGIVSEGMLCSLEELGLAEKSDYVYMTDEPSPLGKDVIETFKVNDWYFDTEITPNRPDCLSYFGVARELSAGLKKQIKFPVPYAKTEPDGKDSKIDIQIKTDGCWRYTARIIENVKIGQSPLWMRRRLIASGLRPINNVVDITNYVMLETGHPIHAFDLSKLAGKIVVRDAQPGERLMLLDGKEYEFTGGEVLITDGEKILGLGGIMGGEDSSISEKTTSILLEVAMFDPVRIRKTSRKLGISSDSSYRFERGVDYDNNIYVIERLSELIQQLAGGTPSKTVIDNYPKKIEQRKVFVSKHLPKKVLGIDVKRISKYIEPLGFEVEETRNGYEVYVPSFRYFDISIPEDVMEEVGRIHGYDNIHSEAPRILAIERGRNEKQKVRYEIKQVITGFGFSEANNLSFASSKMIKRFEIDGSGVAVVNPIVSELDRMRPSLLYGLLESLSYNYKRQMKDVRLFEIGKVFEMKDGKPFEREALGIVATGRESVRDYTDKRIVSFYTFKGAVEEILLRYGLECKYSPLSKKGFVPTRCAKIMCSNDVIGFIGMMDIEFVDKIYDVKDEVYVAEVYLDKIYDVSKRQKEYKSLSPFPFIRRDVSYIIPVGFEISNLLDVYRENPILEEVGIDDIYEKLGDGQYSVTIYAKFRNCERTLSDEEVDLAIEDIKKKIKEKYNISPRF